MPNPFDLSAIKKKLTAQQAASPEGQLDSAAANASGVGTNLTNQYVNRATNFDPTAAYNTAMAGAGSQYGEELDNRIKALNGSAVGAGRIDTGFWDLDKGDVVRGVARDFANTASSNALAANSQTLQNNNDIGNFGMQQQEFGADLNVGRYDREQAAKEEAARKRHGIGGLIGTALGAGVGSFIPGGTLIGAKIGGQIGGAI